MKKVLYLIFIALYLQHENTAIYTFRNCRTKPHPAAHELDGAKDRAIICNAIS